MYINNGMRAKLVKNISIVRFINIFTNLRYVYLGIHRDKFLQEIIKFVKHNYNDLHN